MDGAPKVVRESRLRNVTNSFRRASKISPECVEAVHSLWEDGPP
jgi:hypothetical protein